MKGIQTVLGVCTEEYPTQRWMYSQTYRQEMYMSDKGAYGTRTHTQICEGHRQSDGDSGVFGEWAWLSDLSTGTPRPTQGPSVGHTDCDLSTPHTLYHHSTLYPIHPAPLNLLKPALCSLSLASVLRSLVPSGSSFLPYLWPLTSVSFSHPSLLLSLVPWVSLPLALSPGVLFCF